MNDLQSPIISEKKPSFRERMERALYSLTLTEKMIFLVLSLCVIVTTGIMVLQVNNEISVHVPASGGTLTEGIIGRARHINPLLALTDAEKDLSTLIYSGLLKATPDGALVGDMAESYSVSDDGLTYTFILRPDLTFHDKIPVTVDDVIFTIEKAQDPIIKSPRRANWEGVTMKKVSDRELTFTLKQPYPPFIENTTIGILPKHIWKNIDPQEFQLVKWNTEPIGSGPYQLESWKTDGGEQVPSTYTLKPFKKYALGAPLISHLIVRFYPSERALLEALSAGEIEAVNSISSKEAKLFASNADMTVKHTPLPRIFGIFFNQNQSALFTYPEVRQALDIATDRTRIVNEVLQGYGTAINSPIPPNTLKNEKTADASSTPTFDPVRARKILTDAGWTMNEEKRILEKKTKKDTVELSFTLSTSDAPELKETADILKEEWEAVGARVTLGVFETGDLNQNVIRPRKYDALLFGEIVGRDLDLFAFWHSSQRNDPGLNIALYTNTKTDKLLEEARSTIDEAKRNTLYQQFAAEIKKDIPALFLYSPDFIYILPNKVQGLAPGEITIGSDRFLSVEKWYIETNRVWTIFENSNWNQ